MGERPVFSSRIISLLRGNLPTSPRSATHSEIRGQHDQWLTANKLLARSRLRRTSTLFAQVKCVTDGATTGETCKEHKEPTSDQQDLHLYLHVAVVVQSHLLDTQTPLLETVSTHQQMHPKMLLKVFAVVKSPQSSAFHDHHTCTESDSLVQ